MSMTELTVTYYQGKALAAYFPLPRKSGDHAVQSKQVEAGLVVDFAADGRPIGIEIVSPSLVTLDAVNRVLKTLNLPPISGEVLSPLTSAH